MSFDIAPREYLSMVEETHAEFQANALSVRHLIACCIFASHLPEIVFANYTGVPAKIHGYSKLNDYRNYAIGLCPEVGIIQDLCDFGKHGPSLNRSTVRVAKTEEQQRKELGPRFFVMGPSQLFKQRLIVTLKNGGEVRADEVLAAVVEFWRVTFELDEL